MKKQILNLVVVVYLGSNTACLAEEAVAFRLTGYEATPMYAGLRFERSHDDWRSVVFMDGPDGGLAIQTPTQKGILDWSDLTAVRVTSSKVKPSLKMTVVEYLDYYNHSPKIFEMGLIDDSHLKELRHRYRRYVTFTVSH